MEIMTDMSFSWDAKDSFADVLDDGEHDTWRYVQFSFPLENAG